MWGLGGGISLGDHFNYPPSPRNPSFINIPVHRELPRFAGKGHIPPPPPPPPPHPRFYVAHPWERMAMSIEELHLTSRASYITYVTPRISNDGRGQTQRTDLQIHIQSSTTTTCFKIKHAYSRVLPYEIPC